MTGILTFNLLFASSLLTLRKPLTVSMSVSNGSVFILEDGKGYAKVLEGRLVGLVKIHRY